MSAHPAAYALLRRDSWSSVRLAEIIDKELRPYAARDGGTIRIDGPSVSLEHRDALASGMVTHELATNAVKYGVLSVSEDVRANIRAPIERS